MNIRAIFGNFVSKFASFLGNFVQQRDDDNLGTSQFAAHSIL